MLKLIEGFNDRLSKLSTMCDVKKDTLALPFPSQAISKLIPFFALSITNTKISGEKTYNKTK